MTFRSTLATGAALMLAWVVGLAAVGAQANTFYVDSTHGDDAQDGRKPETAWRTLARVNRASLAPGDRVLFRRGQTWRGQLVPHSGDASGAITYGAFGEGAKPIFLGSVAADRAEDWQPAGQGIWETVPLRFETLGVHCDLQPRSWSLHQEGGASCTFTQVTSQGATEFRLANQNSGTQANHLQLSVTGLKLQEGEYYLFTFQARSSHPCTPALISLMKSGPPWTAYAATETAPPAIGTNWAEHSVRFHARHSAVDARLTVFLGGALPPNTTFQLRPGQLLKLRSNQTVPLSMDVGNIILDHGTAVGAKRWSEADLRREGDYLYDARSWQVKLRSNDNPATRHRSIELALRQHIIDQSGCSYVTYEDLDLRYGAAHGIGGSGVRHVTIRGCDISFIGGGHQMTPPNGKPVRYGNGVEFWSNAHDCLVENCRLWEIYDAALTNQGDGTNVQENITYRGNVIWNSEYSFEYWNRGSASLTRNILFEHNTCVDAGYGWGHGQRPDPNGRHLMFYDNSAMTTNVVVRDNIFCRATDSLLRLHGHDWTKVLVMERNCWFQPRGPVLLWGEQTVGVDEFTGFMRSRRFDRGSQLTDPKFVDAARHDYRLAPDSPARALEGQTEPVGARAVAAPGSSAAKPSSPGRMGNEKGYLSAVLPQDLIRYAGIEVPSGENIQVRSAGSEGYLEFRLVPGQAKKNNGIRAEISVDYPYSAGDIVRYKWEMRLPGDFKADEPRNRWWVMGQWHDQPDRSKGETWQGFPAHSPPVSFNYGRRDGKDFLSLLVGSPRMKSVGLLPITRDTWHALDVVIKWSQGDDGRVAVFFDGSVAPSVAGTGPNMHNGFQHYLKLGMYRHPEISTENRLDIRNVRIEKLKDWPEMAPR